MMTAFIYFPPENRAQGKGQKAKGLKPLAISL
jgi:hypothetical protein